MQLYQASRQWSSRPSDERFTSLTSLADHCRAVRASSAAKVISSRQIEARPVDGDHKSLMLVGPNGTPVTPTHWAFGQLAQRAGAPAGYLRGLPSPLAADLINFGLQHARNIEDVGVLLRKDKAALIPTFAACTGPSYGRVWNETIADGLVERFGNGIDGDFRIPGEFGKAVEISNSNTTLYAGDRDMFVFLADEKNRVTMPNRRNGKSGSLARGFFVWNSEVGAETFGVMTFLFDYACANRIVWGAEGTEEIRIRHTASAPDRWIDEVTPAIEAYSQSSTKGISATLIEAQAKRIDDVDKFLTTRFTKSQAKAIKAAHMEDEQRPIETVWDAVTGATAYARGIQYQDERVDLERKAGKMLDLVAVR